MIRREAVRLLSAIAAVPFMPRSASAAAELGERLHRRLREQSAFRTLNPAQQLVVRTISDAIIPRTDTPGASDVRVPEFIDLILTEWADERERRAFVVGLDDIDGRARLVGNASFMDLEPAQRTTLLRALDAERGAVDGAGQTFGRIKALTIYGYFTSEVVHRDVLRAQSFFETYDPCVPT